MMSVKSAAMAILLLAPSAPNAATIVWTEDVKISDQFGKIGEIDVSSPGGIRLTRIAIGGDADAQSGSSVFSLVGGGLNFSWAAGQTIVYPSPPDFVLDPTAAVSGPSDSARGFTYLDVDFSAPFGSILEIFWDSQFDWDGRYTYGEDALGNFYNDGPFSSARAWISYETQSVAPIPLPLGLFFLITGLCTIAIPRILRRSTNTFGYGY